MEEGHGLSSSIAKTIQRKTRILVVDDEPSIRRFLSRSLSARGYNVVVASDGQSGLDTLATGQFEAALIDQRLPDMEGIELIQRIKNVRPNMVIIIMTAYSSVAESIEALRAGADEYIVKPFNVNHVDIAIKRLLRLQRGMEHEHATNQTPYRPASLRHIIGQSRVMRDLLDRIQRVAAFDSIVLITGESGTGKELVAGALHYNTLNPRKDKTYLAVNCGAMPETLLESELFGYMRGAFTGALTDKAGIFEVTDGGTLFLDEIGEVPPATQAKLLRVLDSGEFMKLGATVAQNVNVRIIAATNKDLMQEVDNRAFRADLYHRLKVVEIHVPPLREHTEDIPELITHFLESFNREYGKSVRFSPQVMEALVGYYWPGNIRELKNLVQSVVLVVSGDLITLDDLPSGLQPNEKPVVFTTAIPFRELKRRAVDEFERKYLKALIEETRGNVSQAARVAKMGRRYLTEKLNAHNINPKDFR